MPWLQCPSCREWAERHHWAEPDRFRLACPACRTECDIAEPVNRLLRPPEAEPVDGDG